MTLLGNARFLTFKALIDALQHLVNPTFPKFDPQRTGPELAEILNTNLEAFNKHFLRADFEDTYNYRRNLTFISQLSNFSSNDTMDQLEEVYIKLTLGMSNFVFDVFGLAEETKVHRKDQFDEYLDTIQTFVVTLYYYYIGAGFVLIILGIMYWFGKRHKSRFEWASLFMRLITGLTLVLLVLIQYLQTGETDGVETNAASDILLASWTIPIVLILYSLGTFAPSLRLRLFPQEVSLVHTPS